MAAITVLPVFFGGLFGADTRDKFDAAILGLTRFDLGCLANAWAGSVPVRRRSLAGAAAERAFAGVGRFARMAAITVLSVFLGGLFGVDIRDKFDTAIRRATRLDLG